VLEKLVQRGCPTICDEAMRCYAVMNGPWKPKKSIAFIASEALRPATSRGNAGKVKQRGNRAGAISSKDV